MNPPEAGAVAEAPASPEASSETSRAWALLRLICGHICLHASMAGMRLAAPLLALHLGHSAVHVGFLLALFSLSQVFLALPAGRYADRHGLRRPMGLGVVVAMVGALLSLLFPVFPVLCVSALCMGAATGGASIALQRHVGRAARSNTELKRVFSWLAIGPAVSNFVGPVSAGLLIDFGGGALGDAVPLAGFRAAFLFMALMPLLGWCFIALGPGCFANARLARPRPRPHGRDHRRCHRPGSSHQPRPRRRRAHPHRFHGSLSTVHGHRLRDGSTDGTRRHFLRTPARGPPC